LGDIIITIENTEIIPMTEVANEAAKNPNITKLFVKNQTTIEATIINPLQILKILTSSISKLRQLDIFI
jgi:hypothetical protein